MRLFCEKVYHETSTAVDSKQLKNPLSLLKKKKKKVMRNRSVQTAGDQ